RFSASTTFISVGSYGATTSARTASRTTRRMRLVPARTSRFRTSGRSASAIADPWVHVGVDQVHDEVRQHEEEAHEEDRPLDDGVVALKDGPEDEPSHPRKGEDLLGHDDTAEEVADLDAGHRDERDQAVLEGMAPDHARLRHALGPRRANVVLPQGFEER